MRKLITIILILAMLIPAAALAEDPDPIVGPWYVFADLNKFPELREYYGDYDQVFIIYYFTEDNMVLEGDTVIKDNDGSQGFTIVGRWQKDETDYTISLKGIGSHRSILNDTGLLLGLGTFSSMEGFMRLYPMTPIDPFSDILYVPTF